MVIQREREVWVDDGGAKIGWIKEIREEIVILETIHGRKIVADKEKIRDIRELYKIGG